MSAGPGFIEVRGMFHSGNIDVSTVSQDCTARGHAVLPSHGQWERLRVCNVARASGFHHVGEHKSTLIIPIIILITKV